MSQGPQRSSGPVAEAWQGAALLGRGLQLITRRPRLFALGVVPPLITSALFVVVLVAIVSQLDGLTTALTPWAQGWADGLVLTVRILIGLAVVGGAILLMVVSFTTLTLTLGAPLYDKLSEAVEAEFGSVPEHSEPAAAGAARAVRQAAALIGISLIGAVGLFAVGLVPLIGQIIGPVLSALFGGWMLSQELTGSAFERRGVVRLDERRTLLRRNRARVLGFAVPTFWLLAIPFAGAVVFPVATAAGTLLARHLLGEPTEPPTRPASRQEGPP